MQDRIRRVLGMLLSVSMLLMLASPVFAADTGAEPTAAATEGESPLEEEAPTEAQTEAPAEAPTQPQTEAPTEVPTQRQTGAVTGAPAGKAIEPPDKPETEAPSELPAQSFEEAQTVDGVTVTVTAEAGVFPADATLSVTRVTTKLEDKISQAIQTENGGEQNVALSYVFDIKVLNADGEELQPAEGATVTVSFKLDEVADRNLSTQVYHISEDEDGMKAKQLDTTEDGITVTAETDGFSYYTVEFTYNSLQYVMEGDSSVPLSDILDFVGLTGVVTEVSVSNDALFSVYGEAGTWMVYSHQAFSSEEWMRVTINGVEYEITVTDANSAWTFRSGTFDGGYQIRYDGAYNKFTAKNDSTSKAAYCLDRHLSSPNANVTYQVASYPTSNHYQAAKNVIALGYGVQTRATMATLFGVSVDTDEMAQQATQIAIWAAQDAFSENATIDSVFSSHVTQVDANTYSLAKALAKEGYNRTKNKTNVGISITSEVTSTSTTSQKYKLTITPVSVLGGTDGYKITIKNLPSGTTLSTGSNTRWSNGDSVTDRSVSGTVSLLGYSGSAGNAVGVFTITVPKSTNAVSVTVSAVSNYKVAATGDVEWGKSPDTSHQNMIVGMSVGETVSDSLSISVPKLPVGSITVVKKDAKTGANLAGCVFGLQKYNGSSFDDTGKTATTGTDGKATFSNLTTDTTSTGLYKVYEKTAPPGYSRDSSFYCTFRVGTGWYHYYSALAGDHKDTLTSGGTVTASINGANKNIITVSKSGDNYSATIYMYDTPDTFSITLNKRDLSTGNAINGATYQLYVTNSSGSWTQFKSGTVNTSGTVTFTGLKLADSANGKFRVIESAMNNSTYQQDAAFEVIINPSTGAWSYKGSFIGNRSGTFTSTTTVNGTISLPDGGTASRTIISTGKDDSLYDFSIWQDDQRSAEHHLTVKKVVNVQGIQWPVSGMTFVLMHQGENGWTTVGTLTETAPNSGIYQPPETSTGWTFPMEEGGTYKVVESTATADVVNSGWESPAFVWSEGTDLNLSYTVDNEIPKGHIGIIKVNSETNAPIGQVGFKITAAENIVTAIGSNSITWYTSGQVVTEGVTDDNGMLVAQNLPYGQYTVTETSYPPNYVHANISFTVTVGAPDNYSGTNIYTDPMIGFTTYPSGMNVTTANGLRYVTVGNTPVHPDMAVAKLTERTVNPSGSAVAFDTTTGRFIEDKVPGTYYNGQNAKFTLTATNTGDVDLFNVRLMDVMSESLWTVVRKQTGTRTTDVTFRQVNSTPLELGNALAVGNTVTTRNGNTAKVTAVSCNDASRTYEITFDKLEPGDSFSLQITFTVHNSLNINQQNLPNDVYLYSDYLVNGTQGALTETPGGGEGDCHDLDKLNVVSQGKVTIHKRSADGTVLSGVHFELSNADGQKVPFVRQSNGDYAASVMQPNGDWVTASASGQTTTTDLVTDGSGELRITELPEGSYSLVETQTVSGQTLLKSPVSIVMPIIKSGAEINMAGNAYFDGANHLYELGCIITNTAQFTLPATGAANTMPIYCLSGMALLCAAALLVLKRRRVA